MGCTMKRWIVMFLGLTLTMGMTTGCQQKCFMAEKDLTNGTIPAGLEDGDPTPDLVSPTQALTAAPPTIDHPDRPARHLSLQEAIAIALENGATGSKNGGVNTPGTVDDSPAVATGGSLNAQSDRVRVLALQPAISRPTSKPPCLASTPYRSPAWPGQPPTNYCKVSTPTTNGHHATFSTSIVKALPSGGVVNTSLQAQYTLVTTPPAASSIPITRRGSRSVTNNPCCVISALNQRTLATASRRSPASRCPPGLDRLQQTASRPTSVAGQPLEGILITRLRFDQQRAEFERQMHNLLLNVEVSYWNLYEAYGALYSNEKCCGCCTSRGWTLTTRPSRAMHGRSRRMCWRRFAASMKSFAVNAPTPWERCWRRNATCAASWAWHPKTAPVSYR